MTDAFQPYSSDPANEDSLAGVIRTVLEKHKQQTDDMIPAKVVAYDRQAGRVTLQPMIKMVTTTGEEVSRAQVVNIPVVNPGGGGFHLSFPIKVGDLGWLKASDRDLSLFNKDKSEQPPNTRRMKSFSDGMFIPDRMESRGLAETEEDAVVLSSDDGAVRIVMLGTGISIITTGTATYKAANHVFDGDVKFNGSVRDKNNVVLETHKHTGVQPGGGSSAGPTN